MKAFWTGAISFGLVNIPIRVYSASDESALDFDMLHKKDLSPIRYARICKLEGDEVPYEEIVKGYEYEKGEYVVVEPEDFKRANPKKTSTIEITSFTTAGEIDPIFFEKPYYMEPEKTASKAYGLFREALKRSKKVGIATFVFRNKEHVGAIFPLENGLVLMQMRYKDTIRPLDSLALPEKTKMSQLEIDAALKLIEQLTESFQPEKYKDTYTKELVTTIEAKLKGKKPARKTTAKAPSMKTQDLMHLLKASLDKSLKESEIHIKKRGHHEKKAKARPKTKKATGR